MDYWRYQRNNVNKRRKKWHAAGVEKYVTAEGFSRKSLNNTLLVIVVKPLGEGRI